ncbi:MAG TPA: malto-oligosyltrehalose trehalohydrolase [Mycobacteriales bacterium]|nr:malto-oligosyltrehalose trehalohydrolase [Mycobacteriales bacterium]
MTAPYSADPPTPWLWAPDADRVQIETAAGVRDLVRQTADGWWRADVSGLAHGTDYSYRIDGGPSRPDPRSRWQPSGVHGPSRLYDHGRFEWTDHSWRGARLPGGLVYELHVGTFTAEGTFDAAIERLDHLVDLGVDLVEVLPVAAFDGPRGWGYDGVDLYAVHEPYGGPDGLKRFVDACHARGMGVVLDVVYNHLGPSGNYLGEFGPYFTDSHSTPWGSAINLDGPGSDEVRRWILDNATMWLRDFHIDGLRLDAVHALVDTRAMHILEELAVSVEVLAAHLRRPLFLIAESDLNDPRLIRPREAGGYSLDAQWGDDVHHALHAALTGERQGYYVDFGSLETLAEALTRGYVHAGTPSTFRGRFHGRPVDPTVTPGWRFVTYLSNHDQVGNRAVGDRPSATLSPGLVKVGAALLLASPYTPMLFMGEEWGASTPWMFFTSFPDEALGEAVRNGRRAEFAEHGWAVEDVPDPQDPATFERSRLDWAELSTEHHAELLEWHRRLIALRRARPELTDGRLDRVRCRWDAEDRWIVLYRDGIAVVCNLSGERLTVPVEGVPIGVLLSSAHGFVFRPGEVELESESAVIVTFVD